LRRLPARVRIWSAHLGDTMIASALMFILNRNICNIFYLCDRTAYREFHGLTVLLAEAAEVLAGRGFRYLDLGPSASNTNFRRGAMTRQLNITGLSAERIFMNAPRFPSQ